MNQPFHIIAFDVPYPPNYGGIVDVFYKLKHLHAAGGKIIYHCFYYAGHNPPTELLEQYCHEIYYYPRKKNFPQFFFSRLPYVVLSRTNKDLLNRLLSDNLPILFDGIQTCAYLNHPEIQKRVRIFRANNVEHIYYEGLAKWETGFLKKQYLKLEARRLATFEKELKGVDSILSVAKMDIPHFSKYGKTHHIPPFFNSENIAEIDTQKTIQQVLFQGNLSVKENEHAAKFIIEKIAPTSPHQFVIAGLSPSALLIEMAQQVKNVSLIDSPPQAEMSHLILNSHINLLLTFQQTGIKLKLLHALEAGRHVVINSFMDDSGIFKELCHVADAPEEINAVLNELMDTPFTTADKLSRDEKFAAHYDNHRNAERILEIIETNAS